MEADHEKRKNVQDLSGTVRAREMAPTAKRTPRTSWTIVMTIPRILSADANPGAAADRNKDCSDYDPKGGIAPGGFLLFVNVTGNFPENRESDIACDHRKRGLR